MVVFQERRMQKVCQREVGESRSCLVLGAERKDFEEEKCSP